METVKSQLGCIGTIRPLFWADKATIVIAIVIVVEKIDHTCDYDNDCDLHPFTAKLLSFRQKIGD